MKQSESVSQPGQHTYIYLSKYVKYIQHSCVAL